MSVLDSGSAGYNEFVSATALRSIDELHRLASGELDPDRRVAFGQFMTPSAIANFMASLFQRWPRHIQLLDPGAGVGSLAEAFATRFTSQAPAGTRLDITAYEVDPTLERYLCENLEALKARLHRSDRAANSAVLKRDFIDDATFELSFARQRYTHAILNPPYKKIGASSDYRMRLRSVGIETGNLYSAFLALSVALTKAGGEIVAIVPRSFCNGTYFRPFRSWLLDRVALKHIHVFESRKKAFQDDDVLQENVIIHLERDGAQGPVTVSVSHDQSFSDYSEQRIPFERIVKASNPEKFIHIPTIEVDGTENLFAHTLRDLGLDVATGPVVDFRLRYHLSAQPTKKSAPLLYAHHFAGGKFRWPREHRKPNAITVNDATRKWLMPRGWYTIIKRFSSKEERRRLVAYVVDPRRLPQELYGFENHLNVIHAEKRGLTAQLAHGLALFLNSTMVDTHFRSFSGHTQVNATDLRVMRFPNKAVLLELGSWARKQRTLTQEQIDFFLETYGG